MSNLLFANKPLLEQKPVEAPSEEPTTVPEEPETEPETVPEEPETVPDTNPFRKPDIEPVIQPKAMPVTYPKSVTVRMHPDIEQSINSGDTPYDALPAVPGGEFLGNIASDRFKKIVEEIQRYSGLNVRRVSDIAPALATILNRIEAVEGQYTSVLEDLAVSLVKEHFGIREGEVEFDAHLVPEVDISDIRTLSPKEIEEVEQRLPTFDIDVEASKRRFVNGLIQGAAINTLGMFHLVADALNQLDPDLVNMYGLLAALAEFGYWVTGNVSGGTLAGAPTGGKSRLDLSGPVPKIVAEGLNFPILVQELSKGVMELVSTHGLPKDTATRQEVLSRTDALESEMWDIRFGPEIWKKLVSAITVDPLNSRALSLLYYHTVQLDAPSFNDLMQGVLRGNSEKVQEWNDMYRQALQQTEQPRTSALLSDDQLAREYDRYREEEFKQGRTPVLFLDWQSSRSRKAFERFTAEEMHKDIQELLEYVEGVDIDGLKSHRDVLTDREGNQWLYSRSYANPVGVEVLIFKKVQPGRVSSLIKDAYVQKTKDGYCVRSEKNPNWSGGCYKTKGEAEKRLSQVEMFKHMKSSLTFHGTQDEATLRNLAESQGLRYDGIQRDRVSSYLIATDPQTDSTLMIPIPSEGLTEDVVKRHVEQSRAKEWPKKVVQTGGMRRTSARTESNPAEPYELKAGDWVEVVLGDYVGQCGTVKGAPTSDDIPMVKVELGDGFTVDLDLGHVKLVPKDVEASLRTSQGPNGEGVRFRKLTSGELTELASRLGVDGEIVYAFLARGVVPEVGFQGNYENLVVEAEINGWNVATQQAIRRGMEKMFGVPKGFTGATPIEPSSLQKIGITVGRPNVYVKVYVSADELTVDDRWGQVLAAARGKLDYNDIVREIVLDTIRNKVSKKDIEIKDWDVTGADITIDWGDVEKVIQRALENADLEGPSGPVRSLLSNVLTTEYLMWETAERCIPLLHLGELQSLPHQAYEVIRLLEPHAAKYSVAVTYLPLPKVPDPVTDLYTVKEAELMALSSAAQVLQAHTVLGPLFETLTALAVRDFQYLGKVLRDHQLLTESLKTAAPIPLVVKADVQERIRQLSEMWDAGVEMPRGLMMQDDRFVENIYNEWLELGRPPGYSFKDWHGTHEFDDGRWAIKKEVPSTEEPVKELPVEDVRDAGDIESNPFSPGDCVEDDEGYQGEVVKIIDDETVVVDYSVGGLDEFLKGEQEVEVSRLKKIK